MTATYDCIATTTLSSAQSSVTFSSISGSFTDLVLVFAGAQTGAGVTYFGIRFNSDTGSNYSYTAIAGDGTTATSNRGSNQSYIYIALGSPITSGQNNAIVHFQNYSNTTTYKTVLGRANNAAERTEAGVALWRSTSAITSMAISIAANNFASGSTFSLYGIKAE